MPDDISTNYVQQFSSSLAMLAQQKRSRFRDTVLYETATGETYWWDGIGSSEAQEITNRNGDTPLNTPPSARRRVDLASYNWASLLAKADTVRMAADPSSKYVAAGNAAMNRAIDRRICASFFADIASGKNGTNIVSFPASQQVAVNSWAYGTGTGNAGLTISKLIEARVVLMGGEAVEDMDEQEITDLYIGVTAKQIGNLLATTETTSKDYNTVQALVEGKISSCMGFKFIRFEGIPKEANGYRRVQGFEKEGMLLTVAEDLTDVDIGPRRDKNNAQQAYYEMTIGAGRLEEARVVEIKCAE